MRLDSSNLPPSFIAAHGKPVTLRHSPDCQCPKCLALPASEPTPYDHHPDRQIPDAKQRERTPPLARSDEGKAQSAERPIVLFTLRRVRLLDADAKYGSTKDLLDGLAYAGLIRGDREDQIILEVRQEKVGSFKKEETVITIENPDGPATMTTTTPRGTADKL